MGLLITNGQFVCMHGDRPHRGGRSRRPARLGAAGELLVLGTGRQCVVSHSRSFVSLSDCYLQISGRSSTKDIPGVSLVEADGGRLQVRGCTFGSREPNIVLKEGVVHAIISENNGANGVSITNEVGNRAIIVNNEPVS